MQVDRITELLGGSETLCRVAERGGISCLFAYGSQARGDFNLVSDLELGVVTHPGVPVAAGTEFARQRIISPIPLRIYGFDRAELERGDPDVPFTRVLFCAELRFFAISLVGPSMDKLIPLLPVDRAVLMEEHAFVRARLLDALLLARAGAVNLAAELVWKMAYMSGRLMFLVQDQILFSDRNELHALVQSDHASSIRSWLDLEFCYKAIAEDPERVRELLGFMTNHVLNMIRASPDGWYPKRPA